MTNKENFLALVSKEKTKSLERNSDRNKNRAKLRESQNIALKVLFRLDELGWKQADLARRMGVSPQQISKIVSGKENLSTETITKLQTVLKIKIFASALGEDMKHSDSYRQTIKITASQVQARTITKQGSGIAAIINKVFEYNQYYCGI